MREQINISFPHMGDYQIFIKKFLQKAFPASNVFAPPPLTKRTLELGSRYSPDFICAPFKFNLGNYIEALETGADVLFQTGLGCRYGYYGEVQEQILRDLGYEFRFVCLSRHKTKPKEAYRLFKELGSPLSFLDFLEALLMTVRGIYVMDMLDYYVRENIGFEVRPGAFETLRERCLEELAGEDAESASGLYDIKKRYRQAFRAVETALPPQPLRVGLIGELYTLMEPFSNFYLEKTLAQYQIAVSRKMSVSFLMLDKKDRRTLQKTGGYLKYTIGANGVDSVAQCRDYMEKGYDGILHLKSFGCTPELNAIPVLMNLSKKYRIPVMHLSFDSQSSETGIQTRLEAFADMLAMRRSSEYGYDYEAVKP